MFVSLHAQSILNPVATITYASLLDEVVGWKRVTSEHSTSRIYYADGEPPPVKPTAISLIDESYEATLGYDEHGLPAVAQVQRRPYESADLARPLADLAGRWLDFTTQAGGGFGRRWLTCQPGGLFASPGGYRLPPGGAAACGHRFCPWCHARRLAVWCRKSGVVASEVVAKSPWATAAAAQKAVFLFGFERDVSTMGLRVFAQDVRARIERSARTISPDRLWWRLSVGPAAAGDTWARVRLYLLGFRGPTARQRRGGPPGRGSRAALERVGQAVLARDKVRGQLDGPRGSRYVGREVTAHVRPAGPTVVHLVAAADVLTPPVFREAGTACHPYLSGRVLSALAEFWSFPAELLDAARVAPARRAAAATAGLVLAGRTARPVYGRSARRRPDGA
jgi:hypothetical protein